MSVAGEARPSVDGFDELEAIQIGGDAQLGSFPFFHQCQPTHRAAVAVLNDLARLTCKDIQDRT
jgi:hypothetical protein